MEGETKEGEARVVLKKIEKKKEMEERGEKQLIFPYNNWTKFYKNATDYSTGKGASTGESFATCWLPSMVANENITLHLLSSCVRHLGKNFTCLHSLHAHSHVDAIFFPFI